MAKRASLQCSCGLCVPMAPETYIGTQVLGGLCLLLFNCPACGSTRGFRLHDEFVAEESEAA